jgi:hypothetical protein
MMGCGCGCDDDYEGKEGCLHCYFASLPRIRRFPYVRELRFLSSYDRPYTFTYAYCHSSRLPQQTTIFRDTFSQSTNLTTLPSTSIYTRTLSNGTL